MPNDSTNPYTVVAKRQAERIAEALEADRNAEMADAMHLPIPELVAIATPHISSAAEPIIGRLLLQLAKRAGVLEAVRVVAFERALEQNDQEALSALGVQGTYTSRESQESEPVRFGRYGHTHVQLTNAAWTWADGTPIPRLSFPEGAGQWAAELCAARLTTPYPKDLPIIEPKNRRRRARRKGDRKPQDDLVGGDQE
jgi:hypothetical protein